MELVTLMFKGLCSVLYSKIRENKLKKLRITRNHMLNEKTACCLENMFLFLLELVLLIVCYFYYVIKNNKNDSATTLNLVF